VPPSRPRQGGDRDATGSGVDGRDELELAARLEAAQRSLAERDERIRELNRQVSDLTTVQRIAVAGTRSARQVVRRVAPIGTDRQRAVSAVLGVVRTGRRRPSSERVGPTVTSEVARYRADRDELSAEYRRWRNQHEPGPAALDELHRTNAAWPVRPLVSIALTVDDVEPKWLEETVDSVVAQVYDRWELLVAPDEPVPSEVDGVVERYVATDSRIRVVGPPREEPDTVPAQRAALQAQGEWVLRIDAGDLLRPDALHRIVAHLAAHGDADIVYGDEDRRSPDGDLERPEFKPDWSPEYLLSRDYLGRPTAVRRSLLLAVGGWQAGFEPAEEDHDLHLRAVEQARHVAHVAGVLYTRRPQPPSEHRDHRSPAVAVSDNPVMAALRRRNRPGQATVKPGGGGEDDIDEACYDVRYDVGGGPTVDIIIPTRDRLDLLKKCITSIETVSTYPSYRITVVDNGSVEEATLDYLERSDLRVVRSPGPFNFSRLVNRGVQSSDAEYILLLNNDITALTADWIEAMLELAQQPEVGAVGCRLLFPDGSVQHEGVALLPEYTAANISWPWPVIRDTSAVTAACMLVRREVYWSIGGFDEDMAVCFNDVDFCLRMGRSGRRVVYTPHAELEHAESATRGRTNPQDDIDLFFNRWGTPDRLRDPFLSPYVCWSHPQRLRVWQ
jgi:GT2 family glycosyltransferase